MDLEFELVRGRIKVRDRESGRTVTLHPDDRISGDRILAYDLNRVRRGPETVEQFIRREFEARSRAMPMERRSSNEWTDELKLDFLRTFFPNTDARCSDSLRSGFDAKYREWCQRHRIEPSNEHGGFSFYGKLDDLMFDCSHPDDSWNEFVLTEKGRALLKSGQP